ncbi:hypothetical protein HK105_204882 [Polyrhizophydium stewartii]|uniref:Uncharacterized protein n=1 Tax=Polyrhizophydium stewartii TaxID=2732419 RepID=A0ABR4N7P9_9FUNG|nr:hypothetical protein HK105_000441 [Polyrhizophydium stewartii]
MPAARVRRWLSAALLTALAAAPARAATALVRRVQTGCLPSGTVKDNLGFEFVVPASDFGVPRVCLGYGTGLSRFYEMTSTSTLTAFQCNSGDCAEATCRTVWTADRIEDAQDLSCGWFFQNLDPSPSIMPSAVAKFGQDHGPFDAIASSYFIQMFFDPDSPKISWPQGDPLSIRVKLDSDCATRPMVVAVKHYLFESCTNAGRGLFLLTDFGGSQSMIMTLYACSSPSCEPQTCVSLNHAIKPPPISSPSECMPLESGLLAVRSVPLPILTTSRFANTTGAFEWTWPSVQSLTGSDAHVASESSSATQQPVQGSNVAASAGPGPRAGAPSGPSADKGDGQSVSPAAGGRVPELAGSGDSKKQGDQLQPPGSAPQPRTSLSPPAIAGIVVGSVIGAAVISIAAVFGAMILRGRRRISSISKHTSGWADSEKAPTGVRRDRGLFAIGSRGVGGVVRHHSVVVHPDKAAAPLPWRIGGTLRGNCPVKTLSAWAGRADASLDDVTVTAGIATAANASSDAAVGVEHTLVASTD